MLDELTKLRETRGQRNALSTELSEMQEKLKTNIKLQEKAILQKLDSSTYETEIVRLRTRIEGVTKAIKSLDAELKQLSEEDATRLRNNQLEQIKRGRKECLELVTTIYLLLAEVISQTNALRKKYAEYHVLSKSMQKENYISMKISNLIYALKNEVPALLAGFPAEIFADDKLPKLDALRQSLKK